MWGGHNLIKKPTIEPMCQIVVFNGDIYHLGQDKNFLNINLPYAR
jgi:hypothetical protein